jgi:hypothetical protein
MHLTTTIHLTYTPQLTSTIQLASSSLSLTIAICQARFSPSPPGIAKLEKMP